MQSRVMAWRGTASGSRRARARRSPTGSSSATGGPRAGPRRRACGAARARPSRRRSSRGRRACGGCSRRGAAARSCRRSSRRGAAAHPCRRSSRRGTPTRGPTRTRSPPRKWSIVCVNVSSTRYVCLVTRSSLKRVELRSTAAALDVLPFEKALRQTVSRPQERSNSVPCTAPTRASRDPRRRVPPRTRFYLKSLYLNTWRTRAPRRPRPPPEKLQHDQIEKEGRCCTGARRQGG